MLFGFLLRDSVLNELVLVLAKRGRDYVRTVRQMLLLLIRGEETPAKKTKGELV